jgi:hypothetical protein
MVSSREPQAQTIVYSSLYILKFSFDSSGGSWNKNTELHNVAPQSSQWRFFQFIKLTCGLFINMIKTIYAIREKYILDFTVRQYGWKSELLDTF